MANVAQINLVIRSGKYQALSPYTIHAATATAPEFVPASPENKAAKAAVVAQLESSGFVRSSAAYVSIEHAAQAVIEVSGSGPDATIGVALWDEPRAAELLGVAS